MRDYAKVAPQFWTGKTGKALKAAGPEAVIVGMYLMTSPHANMIGLYHCPIAYISYDTGLTIEGASKGLASAIEADFCTYDDISEHVFVHEFAAYQVGCELDPKDKRVQGVINELEKAPKGQCWQGFRARYAVPFHLPLPAQNTKAQRRGLQGPSKPGAGAGTGETPPNPRKRGNGAVHDFPPGFDSFWSAYPRKTAKGSAAKAFARIKPDTALLSAMLAAIAVQRSGEQWSKDGGQFIPHPASWLNGRRWEDEPPAAGGDLWAGAA